MPKEDINSNPEQETANLTSANQENLPYYIIQSSQEKHSFSRRKARRTSIKASISASSFHPFAASLLVVVWTRKRPPRPHTCDRTLRAIAAFSFPHLLASYISDREESRDRNNSFPFCVLSSGKSSQHRTSRLEGKRLSFFFWFWRCALLVSERNLPRVFWYI